MTSITIERDGLDYEVEVEVDEGLVWQRTVTVEGGTTTELTAAECREAVQRWCEEERRSERVRLAYYAEMRGGW